MLPAGAADDLAVLLVGQVGDGAGVDDVDLCLGLKGHQGMAPGGARLLNGLGLILIDLAAQGVNSESHGKTPLRFGG